MEADVHGAYSMKLTRLTEMIDKLDAKIGSECSKLNEVAMEKWSVIRME
jgi:hypothetical protein